MDALLNGIQDNTKTDVITNGCLNYDRKLNKRLSRVILYGKKQEDLIDRRTILQRCVEEIGRVRDNDKSECGMSRISSLYFIYKFNN